MDATRGDSTTYKLQCESTTWTGQLEGWIMMRGGAKLVIRLSGMLQEVKSSPINPASICKDEK